MDGKLAMDVLHYHLEDDSRYSLVFITDSKQDVVRWTTEYENRVAIREQTVGTNKQYLIYKRSRTESPLEGFSEQGILEWLDENFSPGEQQALVAIVRAFHGILDEVEKEGGTLALYKQSDFEKIPAILESVTWRQAVPSVAGELLSQFVLQHPMPNANHRTGITFMSRYLATMDDSFEMVDTGEDGSWYRWARPYIHDSKRVGTLRRKTALFRHAHERGFDVVKRKEGIEIDLEQYDLQRNDFHDDYREQHTTRSVEFVLTVLAETGFENLRDVVDDGKEAFLERLGSD